MIFYIKIPTHIGGRYIIISIFSVSLNMIGLSPEDNLITFQGFFYIYYSLV